MVEDVLGEQLEAAVLVGLQESAELLQEVGPVGIAGHIYHLAKKTASSS
jgi:hypothetical protein